MIVEQNVENISKYNYMYCPMVVGTLIFDSLWFSPCLWAQALFTKVTSKLGYLDSHIGTQSGLNS